MDFRIDDQDVFAVLSVFTPPSSILGVGSVVTPFGGPEFNGDPGMYFIFVFNFYIFLSFFLRRFGGV